MANRNSNRPRCAAFGSVYPIVAALMVGCAGTPPAQVSHDAPCAVLQTAAETVWLSNGHVTLGVAPQVGRVVHFGPDRTRNLLWLSDAAPPEQGYVNYGGEKLWPTLQVLWPRVYGQKGGWPPDAAVDGPAWDILERDERCMVMASPVSSALGLRIERRFCLAEDAPAVTIQNTLIRVDANIYPVHAWTIAQVTHPRVVLLDIEAPIPGRDRPWVGFGNMGELIPMVRLLSGGESLAWRFPGGAGRKIGTLGEWLAAVYDDVVFVQRGTLEPGASYPDGSSVQAYAEAQYVELELLSPMRHLQEGERLTNEVRWELMPRRGRSAAELASAIESGVD